MKHLINIKTRNIGTVKDYWTNRKTGKQMVTVWTGYGEAHWLVKNTEEITD